jgi:predicted PurR-regulated permease PerM
MVVYTIKHLPNLTMKSNSPISSTLLFLVGLASLGIAVAFFYNVASTFNAFFTALIIAITVSPVMFGLKKKGAPTWAAYIATVLVLLAVLLIFVLIVVGAGQQFMNALPELSAQSESSQTSISSLLNAWGIDSIGLDSGAMAGLFNPSAILDLTGKFISGLLDTISNGILIGIFILFMLVDAVAVPSKLASYLDAENQFILRLKRYTVLVRRYIGITTIVGLVTGILDTILFSLVGLEFAILWGIIAFLFSFIPTIGFWIALIPPVTLAYLQFGFPTALLVFFGIVIINGFAENIVKPRYMGIGLNLSFFTVFFSVVIWSAILGSLGAILSIPLTLAFKVLILEGDESGGWLFDLLSDKKRPETSEDSN